VDSNNDKKENGLMKNAQIIKQTRLEWAESMSNKWG